MHAFKTARGREPVVSRGQIQPRFGLATRDYSEPAVLCSKGIMLKHFFQQRYLDALVTIIIKCV